MKQTLLLIGATVLMLLSCENKTPKTDACCSDTETCCSDNKTCCSDDKECCCSDNKDSYEIVMNIPLKIKPEHVSAFITAFDKCRTETMKEETCMAYDLFRSCKDSTEFHLYERWKNKPGHQAHMKTDHIRTYFDETEGMSDTPATKMVVVTVCPKINNPE